jgi:hypothetical protein
MKKKPRGGANNIRLWRLIDPAGELVVVRNLKSYLRDRYGPGEGGELYNNLNTLKQHDYRKTAGGWRLAEQRHGHRWSKAARDRKANKPKPAALNLGTAAAKQKARDTPEAHHEADDWSVLDPDGRTHHVRNLRRWLLQRLGDEQGEKVYAGLRQVRLSLAGKTKRTVGSSHGWTLALSALPKTKPVKPGKPNKSSEAQRPENNL